MAIKLYRCSVTWVSVKAHPCAKVERALNDMGIEFERVIGPLRKAKRDGAFLAGTGQQMYPAIRFEDGSWYREESSDMVRTIREGKLMEKAAGATAGAPG